MGIVIGIDLGGRTKKKKKINKGQIQSQKKNLFFFSNISFFFLSYVEESFTTFKCRRERLSSDCFLFQCRFTG